MPANETRAVARLPHLDIELHHRKPDGEGVETLSVTLRAAPDLDTAFALLDPFGMLAAWASLNPWLAAWHRSLADRQRTLALAHRPGLSPPRP